jgi:hypothetical protein
LAKQIAEALRRTPEGVSVINAGGSVPRETVEATEHEETFHRAMLRATGGRGLNEDDDLQASAPMEDASARLRQMRPYLEGDSEVAEELAAMLSGGEWDKLGLTASQAEDGWYSFGKLMSDRYGEPGREILNYGHVLQTSAGDRIRQEAKRGVAGNPSPLSRRECEKGPRYRFANQGSAARATTQHAPRPVALGTPLLGKIVANWDSARTDLRKTFNPRGLSDDAETAGLSLREHAASAAQEFAREEKALEEARKLFSIRTWAENLDFINRVEDGSARRAARRGRPEIDDGGARGRAERSTGPARGSLIPPAIATTRPSDDGPELREWARRLRQGPIEPLVGREATASDQASSMW